MKVGEKVITFRKYFDNWIFGIINMFLSLIFGEKFVWKADFLHKHFI